MFDIGFIEIMIISLVALIVVGPERLPVVARTLGHLLGRARGYINGVKTDIHNEMRMEELKNMHTSVSESIQSIEDSMRQEINEIKTMTSMEEKTPTSVTPEAGTEINSPASAVDSAAPQSAPNSGEKMHVTHEKDKH